MAVNTFYPLPSFFGRQAQTIKVKSQLQDRNAQPTEPVRPPSQVEWGSASNFNFGEQEDFTVGPSIVSTAPGTTPPDDDDNQDNVRTYKYEEVARVEEEIRIDIEGTDGGYVLEKRIVEIVFEGPGENGYRTFHHYVFHNPTT